jgi:HEPN domain-containing protein
MSTEKNVYEALRWLRTGEDDLEAATVLKKNGKFPHACFHAQQAGEKALKAIWNYADADPWGHSIRKLIEDLENVDVNRYEQLKGLLRAATILDRFYIPTRYPNGLPELTSGEAYLEEDAELCIQQATEYGYFLPISAQKLSK